MRCCSARLRCRPASLQVDLNIHTDMDMGMGMDTAIPLLVSLLLACIYIYIYNPDQIRTDFFVDSWEKQQSPIKQDTRKLD